MNSDELNMSVQIIVLIIMISACSGDLHFLSFITKLYDSNVKSFKNFFNLNEDRSTDDASVSMYANEISDNVNEIDDRHTMNYLRKNDLYGVRVFIIS